MKENLSGDDVREGMVCVISAALPNSRRTNKDKTGNSEVKGTSRYKCTGLGTSRKNAGLAKAHHRQGPRSRARGRRLAAPRARRRKGALDSVALPGKLAGLPERSRAGGDLHRRGRQADPRSRDAIAALRRSPHEKILNVEKARYDKMLTHQEIAAMITALGTGIGMDDFDITKLRYHKIIIAWRRRERFASRTLLHFFYRQMVELIERGYVYIAQPPLFNVKKGRTEQYIKDERQMARYLLKKATEDITIGTEKGHQIKGRDLTSFLEKLIELNGVYSKVDRHLRDSRVLDLLLSDGAESKEYLADKDKVDALTKKIQAFGYSTEVSMDEEHSVQKLVYREGSQTPRTIGYELLSSAEYHRLVALHKSIGEMDQPPFVATTESGSTKLSSRQELVSHLMELGKRTLRSGARGWEK